MAKINASAFTKDIDFAELEKINSQVEDNAKKLDSMVSNIVNQYCLSLNKVMREIKNVLDQSIPPSDGELDKWSCELSNCLYFTGEGAEGIGVRKDLSKAYQQTKFNDAYDTAEGTIGDKTTAGENASQQEYLVNSIYSRAYKLCQYNLDAGNEQLQSIKKIISRRMGSYMLSIHDKSEFKGEE